MECTYLLKCERHDGFGTKLDICLGCETSLLEISLTFVFLGRLTMDWMQSLLPLVVTNTTLNV
jgi:hypothetical protein